MRTTLGKIKKRIAAVLKGLVMNLPMPLSLQTWAIFRLPMDPWPRALAYQQALANRIMAHEGTAVQAGPLKGVVCIRDAEEGCLVPKLLGCYEEELWPTVDEFIRHRYDNIIDVGCASGYWLVGLTAKMSGAHGYGFDVDEPALARCRDLIALNKLESRITLGGFCTPAELERLVKGRTLVMLDCEGAEYDLLDPRLAPALRNADIIVECHDFVNPKISSTLVERFKLSHSIERVKTRSRVPTLEHYPALRVLPREHWDAAIDERRPCPMEWLILRSRQLARTAPGAESMGHVSVSRH
jgi:hypothetical protein